MGHRSTLFRLVVATAATAATAGLAGCGGGGSGPGDTPVVVPPVVVSCPSGALASGAASGTFSVAGHSDRDYDLQLPANHVCGTPIAVVFVFHGGGGNRSIGKRTTCPNGDTSSATCIDRVALAAGMAVVFADGTKVPGSDVLSPGGIRTWNAGGGINGHICVSGNACNNGVDDMAYVRALVTSVGTHLRVDPKRIFGTGFSNGAALTHRLACQASDLFAAVAPISGANQFALVNGGCTPARPVAVLDIHGTADGCWPYAGGTGGCFDSGLYVSVPTTIADWATRNACGPATSTALPLIAPSDGTSVIRTNYAGCAVGGKLQHLQIVGGGHHWPRGTSFSVTGNSGGVQSQQLDASQAVIDWFAAHGRP